MNFSLSIFLSLIIPLFHVHFTSWQVQTSTLLMVNELLAFFLLLFGGKVWLLTKKMWCFWAILTSDGKFRPLAGSCNFLGVSLSLMSWWYKKVEQKKKVSAWRNSWGCWKLICHQILVSEWSKTCLVHFEQASLQQCWFPSTPDAGENWAYQVISHTKQKRRDLFFHDKVSNHRRPHALSFLSSCPSLLVSTVRWDVEMGTMHTKHSHCLAGERHVPSWKQCQDG